MSMDPTPPGVLPLPAPSPRSLEDPSVPKIPVGSQVPVKLDNLGPMVVNSDGTLSRITNWENMTEAERERTMRLIAVRNRERLVKQQQAGGLNALSTPLAVASGS